jgi:glutamate-1-semialdehyde 2,1-aminomutase
VRHADWAIFGKNGNDATTSCLMLSRAYTGRAKVLVAEGAYHGSQPWATPIPAGVIDSDRADLISYRFNDSESLATAVKKAGADLAGIVVSAFKHDAFADQELATPEFARLARSLCDGADAVLILDEVRAGFRISADATWSHWYDVQPDLSAWSKAIANGEPLSAVLGNDRLRDAAREVYVTGSFWCQAAPMAAALETQRLLAEQNAPARLEALGKRLRSGLEQHARRAGLTLRQTGPVQMPMVRFDDDAKLQQGFAFCAALLRRGILFHPWHNMFLSTAHTDADIDATLEAADAALAEVAAGR